MKRRELMIEQESGREREREQKRKRMILLRNYYRRMKWVLSVIDDLPSLPPLSSSSSSTTNWHITSTIWRMSGLICYFPTCWMIWAFWCMHLRAAAIHSWWDDIIDAYRCMWLAFVAHSTSSLIRLGCLSFNCPQHLYSSAIFPLCMH